MRTRLTASRITIAFLFAALSPFVLSQSPRQVQTARPPEYTFKIVRVFPHDPTAFTQGLAYLHGFLYEGTGLEGHSSLRKVRFETGEVVQRLDLAPQLFGEGITILKNEIVQLTWRSQIGFVYNASDFHLLRQFSYQGEGWGLATNGHDIFMSDGTAEIRVLDGSTLREKRRLKVHDGDMPVTQIERTGICGGRDFRECVAYGSNCQNLSAKRQSSRLD